MQASCSPAPRSLCPTPQHLGQLSDWDLTAWMTGGRHREHPEQEGAMKSMNNFLASYLERVRRLEADNQ